MGDWGLHVDFFVNAVGFPAGRHWRKAGRQHLNSHHNYERMKICAILSKAFLGLNTGMAPAHAGERGAGGRGSCRAGCGPAPLSARRSTPSESASPGPGSGTPPPRISPGQGVPQDSGGGGSPPRFFGRIFIGLSNFTETLELNGYGNDNEKN